MEKRDKLYEGKAKIIYATDDPHLVIQYFKDDATAFNAQKKGSIADKGIVNNKVSVKLFELLAANGIETHLEKVLNDREQLVKKVEIVPLEVIVRNKAAGSLARLMGIDEGTPIACPLLEYSYKNDALGDPLITENHARAFQLATDEELNAINTYAYKINQILTAFFDQLGLELIDFKMEFGRFNGRIILADEISPDTCRLWEKGTGKKMDKDRFRHDLGGVEEAYQDVLSRVTSL